MSEQTGDYEFWWDASSLWTVTAKQNVHVQICTKIKRQNKLNVVGCFCSKTYQKENLFGFCVKDAFRYKHLLMDLHYWRVLPQGPHSWQEAVTSRLCHFHGPAIGRLPGHLKSHGHDHLRSIYYCAEGHSLLCPDGLRNPGGHPWKDNVVHDYLGYLECMGITPF